MTDLPAPDAPKVLLTLEQVAQWKADLLRNRAEIARLGDENEQIERKLTAASVFLDVEAVEASDASATTEPPTVATNSGEAATPRRRRRGSGLVWADVILEAVNNAPMGLTYAEMRQIATSSELGPKLEQSDKGYHNAVGRLARGGYIIREHGRLFSKDAYERFMVAVEAGEASTTVPQPMAYSPMGEAILDIVSANPGKLIGKGVIRELRKDTEFNATLTPHETSAYNIISRLVRREQLLRRDDGTLVPGRNFPRDRGNPPQRNEAPNDKVAGASEAGEVGASPNENRSLFH